MKRAKFLYLSLLLILAAVVPSCIERIESSQGLTCESDSDCWDNLPCRNGYCGVKTEAVEPAEQTGKDAGSEPKAPETTIKEKPQLSEKSPEKGGEAEPPTEKSSGEKARACKGNVAFGGLCQKDGDCCPGQKCREFNIPNVGKFKLCTPCKENRDCPKSTICCQPMGVCASRCKKP